MVYLNIGEYQKSIEILEKGLKIADQRIPFMLSNLSLAYFNSGQQQKSEDILAELENLYIDGNQGSPAFFAAQIYWGIKLFNEKRPYLLLLLSLIIFSPVSRLTVVVAWWIDTRWEIGTHYSLHFDSFAQAAFQQVVYGSLIQIIPGFLLGSLTIAIMQYRKPVIR